MKTLNELRKKLFTKAGFVLSLAVLFSLVCLPCAAQQLYINEIMSSNGSTIADEDGDFEDWIEILNLGDETINLENYGLSDRPNNPYKWRFPSWEIAPGEYLIVFASGKDRKSGPYLHTSWSISAEGETLVLTRPDGVQVDIVPGLPIPRDISFGRQPDGSDNWFFFSEPTPGAPNTTEGYLDDLDPPVFSHPGGFYTNPIFLMITHPAPGVTLRYTTDGSDPTEDSPSLTGPIYIQSRAGEPNGISMIPTSIPDQWFSWKEPEGEVFKATVIRVRAFGFAASVSPIVTQTYFVDSDMNNRYTLPLISIATSPDNLFDDETGIYVTGNTWDSEDPVWTGNFHQSGAEWERFGNLEFYENNGNPGFSRRIGIRIHGGFTRALPQKSLRIYADRDANQPPLSYELFPGKNNTGIRRFLLRNSGNDWSTTMFRDAMIQSLIESHDLDYQAYRPAVVFLNGEYWGIHNIRERIDQHYLARNHGVDPNLVDMLENNALVEEGSNEHYLAMMDFVRSNDLAIQENLDHLNTLMDIDNYATYIALQIFIRNTDWPANNVRYWRTQTENGRWRWILYDTDFGYSLHRQAELNSPDAIHEQDMLSFATATGSTEWPNTDWSTELMRNLFANRNFQNLFINRSADMLNYNFRSDRVLQRIEDMQAVLAPEMTERTARWGRPSTLELWQGRIDDMRIFAANRPAEMQKHLIRYFGLAGTADITLQTNDPTGGSVRINSLSFSGEQLPWKGTYFQEIPIEVEAIPADGMKFVGWSGIASGTDNPLQLTLRSDASLTAVFESEN